MLFLWAWSSFVQTETPFNKSCFLLKLVEIVPVVLEKKIKYEKFKTTTSTNIGQILIRKPLCHFSLT